MRDELEARLIRLEQLIDQFGFRAPAEAGDGIEARSVNRLATAAHRIKSLTAELHRRDPNSEWDGADAMAARLLLADVTDALTACRTVTGATDARLGRIRDAVHDVRRMVERGTT